MASESIRVSAFVPVDPDRVFDAFLDSTEHRAFTGHAASIAPNVGTAFSLWGGKITGRVVTLEPARRLLLSWRSDQFPVQSLDSRVEIVLEPAGLGTRLTILHTILPEGLGRAFERGWMRNYLEPLYHYLKEGRAAAPGQGGWEVPDTDATRAYPVLRPGQTPPAPPAPPPPVQVVPPQANVDEPTIELETLPPVAAAKPKKPKAKAKKVTKKTAKKAKKKVAKKVAKKKTAKKAGKKKATKKKSKKKVAKKKATKKKAKKKVAKKKATKKKTKKKVAKKKATKKKSKKKVAKKKATKKKSKKKVAKKKATKKKGKKKASGRKTAGAKKKSKKKASGRKTAGAKKKATKKKAKKKASGRKTAGAKKKAKKKRARKK